MDELELLEREVEYIALAVLFQRERELESTDLDFTNGTRLQWDLSRGETLLIGSIDSYQRRRYLALTNPDSRDGGFLATLAVLMVDLARPEEIFVAGAPDTALNVARRILRFEGWNLTPGHLPDWTAQVAAVDASYGGAAQDYLDLLVRHWEDTGIPNESAFDTVLTWGRNTGLI